MKGPPGPLLKLIRDQRIAFLIVGATNTLIGYFWFILFELTIGQHWGYFASLGFAHVFSVLCAFVLYRRFVFRVSGHIFRDLARFELVYLVAIAINFALLPLLVEVFGLAPILAQGLIAFVSAIVSYFGHRGFSFRRAPEKAPKESANPTKAPKSTASTSAGDN
jgi:putative flippase GtrA